MAQTFKYVVYRLTFPNGKIYIGKDIGGDGHSPAFAPSRTCVSPSENRDNRYIPNDLEPRRSGSHLISDICPLTVHGRRPCLNPNAAASSGRDAPAVACAGGGEGYPCRAPKPQKQLCCRTHQAGSEAGQSQCSQARAGRVAGTESESSRAASPGQSGDGGRGRDDGGAGPPHLPAHLPAYLSIRLRRRWRGAPRPLGGAHQTGFNRPPPRPRAWDRRHRYSRPRPA
jgi:hypothetical protein